MSSVAIRASNLEKTFIDARTDAEVHALSSINLSIAVGEFVSILGPSGCGKSTLLNILSGLDRDYSGELTVHSSADRKGGRPRIGYLFQEPRLLPWRTVRSNVELALFAAGVPKSSWSERCRHWLSVVGLSRYADFYPAQLSGGMQQRTAIARAFAVEPDILLMDEPFSALDEITARRMRLELLSIWESNRKTVVLVTHNSAEAVFMSDKVLIMSSEGKGRISDEVALAFLERPRKYDSARQFDAHRMVLEKLGLTEEA